MYHSLKQKTLGREDLKQVGPHQGIDPMEENDEKFDDDSHIFQKWVVETITGWWQLKHFLFSPRTLGKMNPF